MTGRITLWGRAVVPLRAGALAALLSLLLGVVLTQLLAREHVSPTAATSGAAHKGLSSLPTAAQGAISAAIGGQGRSYLVTAAPGGFEALSATQRLRSRFRASGVELSSGAGTLGMSLDGIGYGRSLGAVAPVVPSARANRVVYAHPQVSEWYANGPLGVEQGFTLPRAPSGTRTGPLTLSLALSGNMHAALSPDGRAVSFTGRGAPSLRYGALVATDSRGRTLPSSMHVEAGRLLLRVQDSGASYPLRIDPLVQKGESLTVGEEAGAVGPGQLGFSVALSADGNTALVGAPADDSFAGAVWMFVRSGGAWSQQGPKLTGGELGGEGHGACGEKTGEGEETEECSFGRSIALSADGGTALIGGPRQSGPCRTGECHNQGAAWVFTRAGSSWTLQSTLTGGEEEGVEGRFGRSVALSGDGRTAVIGAPASGGGGGAAFVFTRKSSSWERRPMLTGGEQASGLGFFGRSVAVSGDGATALVGAPGDSGFAGAAWVFDSSGSAPSSQPGTKLGGAEEEGEGRFGYSVALSQDGTTALVGGRGDNNGSGAAWVFARPASTSEEWSPQGAKLTGGKEGSEGGEFGYSVTLSAAGNLALVGAPHDSGGIGAAWLFARSPEGWSMDGPKLSGAAKSGEVHKGWFGSSVTLSSDGKAAMVGAPADGGKAGAVWLFADPATIPFLTGLSPNAGPVAGGTAVTINGSRLASASKVEFGGIEASFIVNSPSSITAVAPAHAAGRVPVIVTTSEGESQGGTVAPAFTYSVAPGVSEVSPAEGPTTGGTTVTITGSHLAEATAVSFGSVPASSFTVLSSKTITAVSPAEPAGKVTVTVSTAGGTGKGHFTFVTPPEPASEHGSSGGGGPSPGSTPPGSAGVLGFGPLCSASLVSRSISVLSRARATVRLIWRGIGTCAGKLKLTVRVKAGKRVSTKTIATGTFTIAAGRTRTITVKLNRLGRTLLGAGHGRLRASLVIVNGGGSVTSARTASVRLTLQIKRKATAPKK
jgi:hypothetical protein